MQSFHTQAPPSFFYPNPINNFIFQHLITSATLRPSSNLSKCSVNLPTFSLFESLPINLTLLANFQSIFDKLCIRNACHRA